MTDGVRAVSRAAGADRARPRAQGASAPTQRPGVPMLHSLQRGAGNRAVADLVSNTLDERPLTMQRVPVTASTRQETLFNNPTGAGQATARVYGGNAGATFDMSRSDTPAQVVVTVRIRFVDQARSATGANTGPRTVIPPPDPRRAWAQGVCTSAPGLWNGRARLTGQRSARTGLAGFFRPDPGGPVTLPLVFRAVPVWDLTSPADKTIAVFGSATVAGGNQHPIDAGHYYMNRGGYPFSEAAIYAHEYGHLIGLPDEYSHSNPQMHALLHDIDPATAATRGAAMDRATVRRMVLAALTRPLFDRLSAAGSELAAVFARSSAPVSAALGREMASALNAPAVAMLLTANLPATSARLAPRVPRMLRAASGARTTSSVARRVVRAELDPAALGALVNRQYYTALRGLTSGAADIGGIGMNINVQGNAGITSAGQAVVPPTGVWNAAATGPSAANATAVADQVVGAAGTGGRIPPVRPSTSILRQLESLPAGWAAFRTAAPAALASGTLQTDLVTALTAAWVARLAAGGGGPAIDQHWPLYQAVRAAVTSAATAASTNAVRAFLSSEITPVLQSSVTSLQAAVGTEVDRIMGTPAGALATAGPTDPNLAALATSLRARLQTEVTAARTAQAGTAGTSAVNPGAGAPAQSVTYGTVNMMSDNTNVFRPDQFVELARRFNESGLRRDREGDFRAVTS